MAPRKNAATQKKTENTPEQGGIMNAGTAPAPAYTEEQVQKMIAEAVAKAMAEAQTKPAAPAQDGMVTMRYFDEVNDRNTLYLGVNGKYGQIIGKRWTGQVPKMAFIGDFRTPLVQKLLENRNLIVLDGLTDDERKLYGVCYQDGEFIDEKLYDRLIRMPEEDLLEIYRGLCPEWRRMVSVRFADAYNHGKLRVTREALLALNRESKRDNKGLDKNDPRRKGAFYAIIQAMNMAEDDDTED